MASSPDAPDFIVLGLGNPGERYRSTRHNFGFLVLDALAEKAGAALGEGPGPCRSGTARIEGRRGILAKPTTWMNRSGLAARAVRDRWPDTPGERTLVVFDDLDLPLGRIRFRRDGGAGGHNGVRSVIEETGSPEFARLRLGIGRPETDESGSVVDHVLDTFLEEERETVRDVIDRGIEGISLFVTEGIEAAMNRYNAA
ncbi:MAG TPA: aminoacyl-tRNA hydrolase [bacterium]|nr:aminoacyl-tRNA hydrolase [bacterium]